MTTPTHGDKAMFTPAQCRAAFYQAAANIEARPELYDFQYVHVGESDCPACMWGHVGRAFCMSPATVIMDVADAAGFIYPEYEVRIGKTDVLYDFNQIGLDNRAALPAAAKLRAFADHHWPAEQVAVAFYDAQDKRESAPPTVPQEPVRPDLVECGQSFADLMRDMGVMA